MECLERAKLKLALKYATRYREQYSAIFFVSAANMSTLQEGYERIVHLLDLPEKSRVEWEPKVAAARAWFENTKSESGTGWLLIVDNIAPVVSDGDPMNAEKVREVTVVDIVSRFLPRAEAEPKGSVLFTTRKPQAAEIVVG
jgi:hypothetical protein